MKWAFISPDRLDLISHMTLGARRKREGGLSANRLPIRWFLTRESLAYLSLFLIPIFQQAHGRVALAALSPLSAHLLYCLSIAGITQGGWLIHAYHHHHHHCHHHHHYYYFFFSNSSDLIISRLLMGCFFISRNISTLDVWPRVIPCCKFAAEKSQKLFKKKKPKERKKRK